MAAGWDGLEDALDDLQDIEDGADDAMSASLRASGEAIMTDVKASRAGKGVPVDTGTLRSSGQVKSPDPDRVTLSFGGAAAPYALRQHEDQTLSHSVGEARYLVRGWERFQNADSPQAVMKKALDEIQSQISTQALEDAV